MVPYATLASTVSFDGLIVGAVFPFEASTNCYKTK
jgi:hypothetical protein